jgi:3'-phosphoadenosine 5'-phosphosulfate sulfotransferase (PAPS reductase)/FAD synthetase
MTLRSRQRPVDRIDLSRTGPKVLAYGIGVDSTALLIELVARGEPPDLVLTADTGSEKPETYEYQAMMAAWMADRGIAYETVRYVPKRFKHWPPYFSLLENVLTNATLPSISLGRHSCSLAQLEQCFWKRHFCSMTCTHRRECYHYIFGFG